MIVDDFDTIHLPKNAGIVNGLFTWYISSTNKKMDKNYFYPFAFTDVKQILLNYNYGCSRIMENSSLFHLFNVRNNDQFIKDYNNLSNPKFYIIKYKNSNDIYVGLLGELGNNKTNEIIEMINSGSLVTAAEKLNIQSIHVSEMFEKILGGQYLRYKKSVNALNFINKMFAPFDSK